MMGDVSMKKIRIALIGAGNLGSRHLQALALLNADTTIHVIDPSQNSLRIARERFNASKKNIKVDVIYSPVIPETQDSFDVAIIATNSSIRRKVIEEFVQKNKVKFIIMEKIVFQQCDDFSRIKELLDLHNIRAWVNCPRRMFSFYKNLKSKLKGAAFLDLTVKGSQWGLGCNAVHMLDLYAFLCDDADISLNSNGLNTGWIDSKRPGYIEFVGSLLGKSKFGQIELTSYPIGNMPLVLDLASDKMRCIIHEDINTAYISTSDDQWKWSRIDIDIKYQSELTNLIVEDLVETAKCGLTSFEESTFIHKELLTSFIGHMKKSSDKEILKCPIT